MADMMLQLALALSILGLILIAYVSPTIRPPASSVSDISTYSLEKTVRVIGNVNRTHTFKGGAVILALSDGKSTLDVYLSRDAAAGLNATKLAGRRVEASGTVQLYRGKLELSVERPDSVRLI